MKNLKKILQKGAIYLATVGTLANPVYSQTQDDYIQIGEDKGKVVREINSKGDVATYLSVITKDRRIITYVDSEGGDLQLEKINVMDLENGISRNYNKLNKEIGKPVIEANQIQFLTYLKKIREAKIAEGLELLKK